METLKTKSSKIRASGCSYTQNKAVSCSKTLSEETATVISVIITAAGSSTRMGGKNKKEYLPLETGTVLSTSLKKFLLSVESKLYIITTPVSGIDDAKKAIGCDAVVNGILEKNPDIEIIYVEGGKTRQESILNALEKIATATNTADNWAYNFSENVTNAENNKFTKAHDYPSHFVLIHDAARPFVTSEVINRTLDAAITFGAAFPGIEPTDTQKQIDKNGKVINHLKRSDLISVQTPQIFEFGRLYEAHKKAANDGYPYTDDAEIWGRYCGNVIGVKGDAANIKITYSQDYVSAVSLKSATGSNSTVLKMNGEETSKMIRVGLGYDLHKLVEGRRLVIGGVEIPFEKGEDGHSDGDVLLHAITDALLGAAGLGDIGSFFPPEDDKWKNADSKMLLQTVWEKITADGWSLQNIDCVIKLEKPKFLPYREQAIKSIAEILGVPENTVFVKAKTYEKTGNWENQIEAFANCLLEK